MVNFLLFNKERVAGRCMHGKGYLILDLFEHIQNLEKA